MMTINIRQDYASASPNAPVSNLVFPKPTDPIAEFLVAIAVVHGLTICRAAIKPPNRPEEWEVLFKLDVNPVQGWRFGIDVDPGISGTLLLRHQQAHIETASRELFRTMAATQDCKMDALRQWLEKNPHVAGAVYHFETRNADEVLGLINT